MSDSQSSYFYIGDIASVINKKALNIGARPDAPKGQLTNEYETPFAGVRAVINHMLGLDQDFPLSAREIDMLRPTFMLSPDLEFIKQMPLIPDLSDLTKQEQDKKTADYLQYLEKTFGAYHQVTPLPTSVTALFAGNARTWKQETVQVADKFMSLKIT